MKVSIERGLIKVKFSPELELEDMSYQMQDIVQRIGSAHAAPSDPRMMSCNFSADNLRKLRELGAVMDNDPFTRETIQALRARVDQYEADTLRFDRIKKGLEFANDAAKNYHWKIKPYAHQVPAFNVLVAAPNYAFLGDTGTGKTGACVAFMDHLIKTEKDWVFFVVCPTNLINNAWKPDIGMFSDLKAQSLRVQHWKRSEKLRLREEAFATDADIYLINFEGPRGKHAKDLTKEKDLVALMRRRRKQGMKIGILVDESSKIKSKESAGYRMLKRIGPLADRRVIITGGPAPNGVLDLWSQYDFMDDGETLPPAYTDFRQDTHKMVVLQGVEWISSTTGHKENATKWLLKEGAALAVYKRIMKRSIRFRIEDCIDLPAQRFLRRDIEMTKEQARCYEQMREHLITELEGDLITAKVAVVKLMKLREITGGFIMSDGVDAKAMPIDKDTPKMLELDTILEQSIADQLGDKGRPNKAIVWAQYQWECKTLVERYRKKYGARGMFGGISSTEIDNAFRDFQDQGSTRLLICHPASVGHGLTLTAANYSIFYSLSYNYDEFYQAYRRMARATQTRTMTTYMLICPGTIDEHLMTTLRGKKNLSDIVTDGRASALGVLQPVVETNQTALDFKVEATNEPEPAQGGAQDG